MQIRTAPPYSKLALLSFLAAVSVVYWHAGNWTQFGLVESSLGYAMEQRLIGLMMWAVPFFFLVSGYLFFHGFTMKNLFPKWKRRMRTLLVPYLIWNALYYLYYAVALRIPPVQKILMTPPVELSLTAALEGVFLHSCLGVMWYLVLLMLFVLLAPLFYLVFRRRIVGGLALVILFTLVMLGVPFPANPISLSYESIFFFGLGAYLGLCFPSLPALRPPRWLRILSATMLMALLAATAFFGKSPAYPLLVILLSWLMLDPTRVKPRFLYSTSFFLYVTHMMLIQLPEKLLTALLPHTDAGALTAYAISPLLTVGLVAGLAYLLVRLLPRLYALLTGGRS